MVEDIDFSKVDVDATTGETELTLDDLNSKFIPHPKVGEETAVMHVLKFVKTKDVQKVTKEGEKFSIALKTKDGKGEFGYILKTENGDYTIGSWDEYFKIRDICKKIGRISDFKIKIKHVINGMIDKKAQKEGRCYVVELVK